MRRLLLSLLALTPALSLPALAAEHETETARRAVTHEDVWLMRRLGTPVVSPDGRRAVFAVTEPSYDDDGTVSDLWAVDVDGRSQPRRLTATASSEDAVVWSPDGTRIAFSAKRGADEDPAQIFVLDMTGPGEAVQITDWPTGATTPQWSPDGRRIAFESRVYPVAATAEAQVAEKQRRAELGYNVSAFDTFPIRQWDRWRDDLQTHLFVQDAEPGATAVDVLAGSELVSGPGYAAVPARGGESLKAAWAPDGKRLVISATTNLHEAAFEDTYYHLYEVPVTGGAVRALTAGSDWSCHSARFAPDGRSLVCKIEPSGEFVYELTELGRFDWPVTGAPALLTADFDRSVNDFDIDRQSRTVTFTAHEHGRVRLFQVPLRGGKVRTVDDDSDGVYAGAQTARGGVVARWESSVAPAEIVRVDPRSGERSALTSFNVERAAGLDRPPFREFWFESTRGRRIHNWLVLPPGFDASKRYPLVLFIHGGPHSSSLDADHVRWSPHLLAAPGYVVLLTDYTGSVGYGETFAQNIQGDPLKTPGDELVEAVDAAIERFDFIDPERLAAAGASYGGHLANWLQATTTRFDTLINHAGLVDLEGQWASSDVVYHREINNGGPVWGDSPIWREQSPATYADRFATPMLLTIGEKDYRVPINQTIAAWTYLKRNDIPGRLLVFHDANHWIMKGAEARYYWEQVHAWLAQHLAP